MGKGKNIQRVTPIRGFMEGDECAPTDVETVSQNLKEEIRGNLGNTVLVSVKGH